MIFETLVLVGGVVVGGGLTSFVKPRAAEWLRKVFKHEPTDHSLDEFDSQQFHPFDCCRCPRCDHSFDAKTLPSTIKKAADVVSSIGQSKRERSLIPMLLTAIKPDTLSALKTATKKVPSPTTICECVECPEMHYHLYCPICSAIWKMRVKA
jgi:hypothetical protein